jgi:hypothetical protein
LYEDYLIMIIEEPLKEFDGSLISNRFATKFFGENTLRIGNIVCFKLEEDCEIFAWEIPDFCHISNVLFKKIFTINIANFITDMDEDVKIMIDDNDNILLNECKKNDGIYCPKYSQISEYQINTIYPNVSLGYIKMLQDFYLSRDVEEIFYRLMDSVFLESFCA